MSSIERARNSRHGGAMPQGTGNPGLQAVSGEITLLPGSGRIRAEELAGMGEAIACDFYVDRIEELGAPLPWGFRLSAIENIDHHAPQPRFERFVSSANLAIERVRAVGPAKAGEAVAINHTDCDSVLSSAIVAGRIPPEDRYGRAAIAADHTGEENSIADLLQGLDEMRDLELSLASLVALEAGGVLSAVASAALATRRAKREQASTAVAAGEFRMIDTIAYGAFPHMIDGEFFPALLPHAAIIVVAHRLASDPTRNVVKARLGAAAPDGLTLHALPIHTFDPAYGGRWNAGSDKRHGGTTLGAEAWAGKVAELVRVWRRAA